MPRNIFIDESARDAEDDWEEEQEEEEQEEQEQDEHALCSRPSPSVANPQDLSATNRARWSSAIDGIASAYATGPSTQSTQTPRASDVATSPAHSNTSACQTNLASQTSPSLQSLGGRSPSWKAGGSDASGSSPSTTGLHRLKVAPLPLPRPFVPEPHQYLYSGWLGPQRPYNEMQTLNAPALLLQKQSLEWTRMEKGRYRRDLGLLVEVADSVATIIVVPRIVRPDKPRQRPEQRFFTSKEIRRYMRRNGDFIMECRDGFFRWTEGSCHSRNFKAGFEVLSVKSDYSGPGALPSVEEFQLFYTNHCPHLDTPEGIDLLDRTSPLLMPNISPRESCEVVGGPLLGSIGTVTAQSHVENEFIVAILGGSPAAAIPACWLRRFFRPGDLVEARLGFHLGLVAFVVDVQDTTVTAIDIESSVELTLLRCFLVFHNETYNPAGSDGRKWVSVGQISRAPNGVQIGDMCEVVRGPDAGIKGRLIDKIGKPSSIAYGCYRTTYALELGIADRGTRALVEVDGSYRLVIAPTDDIRLLTDHMPVAGADVSRLTVVNPRLSTITPVQTSLDRLADRFSMFIGYRIAIVGFHPLKGYQGWLRAVSMDLAVCELDHSAVVAKNTHQLHVDKVAVYCSTWSRWVKLEDAIRPGRIALNLTYEKAGAPLQAPMQAEASPAPTLPSPYLGSFRGPDSDETGVCDISKWIEWFPAMAAALPTPSLLVKLLGSISMLGGRPNVWRITKLNSTGPPLLSYGVEGVYGFPIKHLSDVPPDSIAPLRPSEVQRPYEALVIRRRHTFFGRIVLIKPTRYPDVWVVSLPTGKDKRTYRLEETELVLYGRL